METFKIIKIKNNNSKVMEEAVAKEIPLTIILDDKEIARLLCSPIDMENLVRGFLFTGRIIKKVTDIKTIAFRPEESSVYIELCIPSLKELNLPAMYASAGGKTTFLSANRVKINSKFSISTSQIQLLMEEFLKKSDIFLKTGGVHSAAAADEKGIIIFKEDIGRHNAIDKIIGHMLSQDMSFEDKFLITSGRISSEIVRKVHVCRIPIIVSKAAVTNEALRIAGDVGMTLVGFVRGNSMNIYSREGRIKRK